jgi:hypothetical protein
MKVIGLLSATLFSAAALAQAPANAPVGSTGLCVDGTYISGKEKSAACTGHQGIEVWWGVPTKQATPPVAREPYDKALAPAGTVSASDSSKTTDGKEVGKKPVPPAKPPAE